MYVMFLKDPDIPFEIRFNGWKFRNGDIQDRKVFHELIFFIGKRLPGQHHVVHGYGKLAGHGVGGFLPFSGLGIEVVSPSAEHFGVVTDQPVRTGNECFMQLFVAAAFACAGHMLRADLEARVESAVGSKGF